MNKLSYNSAIKIDKKTYLEYYLSLLGTKHLFIFSFWPVFDYNSQILKKFKKNFYIFKIFIKNHNFIFFF